jgi:hypothetical protein
VWIRILHLFARLFFRRLRGGFSEQGESAYLTCPSLFSGLDPKHASPMSGRRFLAPLIAETRRRIAGDRPAMAEPGSIE